MKRKIINGLMMIFPSLIKLLDFLAPKDDDLLFIGSGNGKYRSGSSRALDDYIQQNGVKLKTYYYLPNEGPKPLELNEYIKAGRIFLRARYLVTTHPPGDFFPFIDWSSRKILINFGHGTPVKNVGFADPKCPKFLRKSFKRIGRGHSIYPVSSGIEEAWLTKCFLFDPSIYLRCGQPRNDVLVKSTGKRTARDSFNILYCPTYRSESPARFFPFPDFDYNALIKFLEINNMVIFLRPHYLDCSKDTEGINELLGDRIRVLSFDDCNDINTVLPEMDALISDYSSLYYDFLLLDRPCIFVPYDIDTYIQDRGLLFDDYELWAPGFKIHDQAQFLEALTDAMFHDSYASQRNLIKNIIHYYQTDDSCRLIIEKIREI